MERRCSALSLRGSFHILLLEMLMLFAASSLGMCPSGVEPLISGSRYRVDDQFLSSNLNEPESVPQLRLDGSAWCSPVTAQQPWVQVEFGSDVTIHTVQIAGHDGFLQGYYITRFQVHIGNSTAAGLSPILEPNSTTPMEFARQAMHPTEDTDILPPVTTRVLRIVIVERVPSDDEVCIDLEALGCLTNQLCTGMSPLTESRDLLPLSSITANSANSGDPAEDVVDRNLLRNSWCSDVPFTDEPYIQLNFSSEVVFSHMFTRGSFFLGLFHVTGFRLDVLDETTGNFVQYGVTDEPTVFTAMNADLMLYTFWRPAEGSVFRFAISDGQGNLPMEEFCWNIQIFGCLSNGSAAPFTPPPTAPMTTDSMMETTDFTAKLMNSTIMETPSEPTRSATTQQTAEGGSRTAVIVGASVAVVVVAAIVAAVCLLFILCVVCGLNQSDKKEGTSTSVGVTESSSVIPFHEFDNAIYGEEIKSPSPPLEETQDMGKSPNNTYESLPSYPDGSTNFEAPEYAYADATVITARVPTQGGSKVTSGFAVQDEDGMERNVAYESSMTSADSKVELSKADNPLYGST